MASAGLAGFVACALALATTLPVRASSPARDLARVPIRLHDNRILVDVLLNGKGPFTMILDTGASNVITPECRRRLGLADADGGTTSGAGEKTVSVGRARLASLRVGALEMRDQEVVVVDLGEIRRGFRFPKLDGIVGRELFERAHARVDLDRGLLLLSEPDTSGGAPPAGAVHMDLADGSPVVVGRINGTPAGMLVDTGDRSNLTVFERFAAISHLDSLFAGRDEIPTGIGVGGVIPGRVAKVASITFGPVTEEHVVSRLPSTRAGIFATSPLAGSIGLGLLRNYNLEIDYRNGWMRFEPRHAARLPSEFVPLPVSAAQR